MVFNVSLYHIAINDELYKMVETIQAKLGEDYSISRTINYLIYLGGVKLANTLAFADLSVPSFDVDNPTRQTKEQKEASPEPPEEKIESSDKQDNSRVLPKIPEVIYTQEQAEEIFKTIPNFANIPPTSATMLILWLSRGAKLEGYDGEYIYDMVALRKDNIIKPIARKWSIVR